MGSGIDGNGGHAKGRVHSTRLASYEQRVRVVRRVAGNACKRHELDGGVLVIKVCRYCGNEQTIFSGYEESKPKPPT